MNDTDEWWSVTRVAEEFAVHPKTVSVWAKEGKIPSQKTVGGHYRFRKSEILKVLEEMAK